MLPLLALPLAIAAPSERLERLADERNWPPAHTICTRQKADRSTDADLRELCATAAYKAEPPSGSAALHRFALRWKGTESGALAFERAAAAAEPGAGARESLLVDHMNTYAGTEAAERTAGRIESAAYAEVESVGSESAYLGFVDRFPDGELAGKARMAALEAGIAEALSGVEPRAFEDLVRRYPDAEDRIRAEAAQWARTAWLRALTGPCWQSECPSIAAGQTLSLAGPTAVGGAVPTATWVLTDGETVLRDTGVLSEVMGIAPSEWSGLLAFHDASWTAPFDWAQPPPELGLSWALEVSIETEEPVLVPLMATDRWLGVSETFYAWTPEGVIAYVEGQPEILWDRGPEGEATVLHDGDHLWAIDDVHITRYDLSTGEQLDAPAPRDVHGLSLAGPDTLVAWQKGRRVRCGLRGCTPYANRVLRVAPGNGRTVSGEELVWTIRDADGTVRRQEPRPYNPDQLPLPEAALDHTGARLLVVSYAPSPPTIRAPAAVMRLVDLATGSAIETRETVGYVERVEPAGYPDAFLLTVRDCVDCETPTRQVLLERRDGRLEVVPADAATLALAARGPWRAQRPSGFPEGTEVEVLRSGDQVQATLLRDVMHPLTLADHLDIVPEGCDGEPDVGLWWMSGYRYLWATVRLHSCQDLAGTPTTIKTLEVLVDTHDSSVWEAGDVHEMASFLAPSGSSMVLRSWTMGTRLLTPAGSVMLPEGTRHGVWGDGAAVLATITRPQ